MSRRDSLHGGAKWQPLITDPASYDALVCADVNDAYYPPAPRVVDTIKNWAHRANFASDDECRRLRKAVAALQSLPEESIHFGWGSSELLQALLNCFLRPGDRVAVLDPTYSEYQRCATDKGALVQRIVLNGEEDFRARGELIEEAAKVAQFVVICNPNNPTGQVIPKTVLFDTINSGPPTTIWLIDEAYIHFCEDESLIGDVAGSHNLIVVRTFSKAYALSGLRVGYAVLPEKLGREFQRMVRPPWSVGLLAARAAEVALAESNYLTQMISETCTLRDHLVKRLGKFRQIKPVQSVTNYFLLRIEDTALSSAGVCEELAEHKVFVRDCAAFGQTMQDRYVRITTQDSCKNDRIISAISTVLR
jgi:histidinol-phosphate aminotransferase